MLLTVASVGFSYAQNGNFVLADVQVQDLGNGSAMIVVHISGNQASEFTGGLFQISGDRIPGGTVGGGMGDQSRVIIQPPVNGNGNTNGNQQVVLAGVFPISPSVGNGNQGDQVTMDFRLRRIGNGIDYTYSRVGRIRRHPGI